MANGNTGSYPQAPARAAHGRNWSGVVTSAKMQKTIVVKVTRIVQHRCTTG